MWQARILLSTLEIAVEPFGLRGADVTRPPPRVSVARRTPQHRGLLPPSPPPPLYPCLFYSPNRPLVFALRWQEGPQGNRGRALVVEKAMARYGDREAGAPPWVAGRSARGG
jgi:hypothetical protein